MLEKIKNQKIASFILGGEKIDIIPGEMTISADSYSMMAGDIQIVLDFMEVAKDFYRWVVKLTNCGTENTAQITEFYGMDLDIPVSGETVWESIYGDTCNGRSYYPRKKRLTNGTTLLREAYRGRSSRGDYFPYFDITSDLGSAVFALGWTGQWKYTMEKTYINYNSG